jgi:hypothetical protein
MKTLDELRKKAEVKKSRGSRYFSLKGGESQKIWFLQELTEDGKNFKDEVGTAELVEVVTNPNDYKKSARVDTLIPEFADWRPKSHLLVNIAVLNKDTGVWEARVLDQKPNASAHVATGMIEYADAYGTITDRPYKISRTGSGPDTQYTLIALLEEDMPPGIDELELHDLDEHYQFVSADKQASFFLGLDEGSETEESSW